MRSKKEDRRMYTVCSNTEHDAVREFITGILEGLSEKDIRCIGIYIDVPKENAKRCGYWNMRLRDKMEMKNHVELDVMDQFILTNKDRYGIDYFEEDEEECEEE